MSEKPCSMCERPMDINGGQFCGDRCYMTWSKVVSPIENQLTTLTEERDKLRAMIVKVPEFHIPEVDDVLDEIFKDFYSDITLGEMLALTPQESEIAKERKG